jgi:hypothetical protein
MTPRLTLPEWKKNMTDFSFVRSFPPRLIAVCLSALLVSQSLPAQQEARQPSSPQQQSNAAPPPLPINLQSQPSSSEATPASKDALPSAPAAQEALPSPQQPAEAPSQPQEPLGTAAAPVEKPTGVAGSRPSGAAIAPAKQRRVRAIVISVALVLAAGVAIGATAGLSRASHSAPQ